MLIGKRLIQFKNKWKVISNNNMHTFALFCIGVGTFGMLLGVGIHIYGHKKHDAGWLSTAQQTAFRGVLIFVLGVFLLICGV